MNRVFLLGNLTHDPDISYGKNDTTIAKFTIAVRRNSEITDFIYCTAFNKTAEILEKYFSKGKRIAIEGEINTGSYENKEGETVYYTNVIARSVDFCEKASNDGTGETRTSKSSSRRKK